LAYDPAPLYANDKLFGPIRDALDKGVLYDRYVAAHGWVYLRDGQALRLCVPDHPPLRSAILTAHHDHPGAGHRGGAALAEAVGRRHHWRGLRADALAFTRSCPSCQRNKSYTQCTAGHLQPLPIPTARWDVITTDFVVHLPRTSRGFDAILVISDKLSKRCHFIPCHDADDAPEVARLFVHHIFRLHGLPRTIVSDRDPKFTSAFWAQVCHQLGIRRALSTAKHAQTDGQSERAIRTLKDYLRHWIDHHQTNWDDLLPLAEFAYNDTMHTTTAQTPFQLDCGRHPTFQPAIVGEASLPAVITTITEWHSAIASARESLHHAADSAVSRDLTAHPYPAATYEAGAQVLVSTQLLTPAADRDRPARKLTPRFVGPFTVAQRTSPNTYRLTFPPTVRTHPIINSKFLRPFHSPSSLRPHVPAPPPITVDDHMEYEVETIVDHRRRRGRIEYLVQWRGYAPHDATWLPAHRLAHASDVLAQFQATPLGRQVV